MNLAHAQMQSIGSIVAVVNNQAIMSGELDQRVNQVRQQLIENHITPPDDSVLKRQVLDRLIIEQLQLQLAQQAHMNVSNTQLDNAVKQVAARNHLTLSQFIEVLARQGISYDDVRNQILKEMLISQIQQASVANQVRVTEREVDQYLQQQNAAAGVKYHLAHILVPLHEDAKPAEVQLARQKIEQIRQQLLSGKNFATMAASKSADGKVFSGGDLGWLTQATMPTVFTNIVPSMQIGEISQPVRSPSGYHIVKLLGREYGNLPTEKVQQYKASHILISPNPIRSMAQAHQLALKLRQELIHGANFADLAKKYSDDLGTALSGGELGWVNDGDMVPAFNAVLKSAPLNEVSAPVQTEYGWHLIKVEGRRLQDVTLQAQRQHARQAIFERKAQDQLESWLQQIRASAYVENRLFPKDDGNEITTGETITEKANAAGAQ